ncbi:MAG: hypothetical protein HUJ24_14015, partial [Rhodobacteraceae bacterium]|nr:hypothetical protein [Paracoccaceae bacterium]
VVGGGGRAAGGRWAGWAAGAGWGGVALRAVLMVVNWSTPSTAERKLWGPITTVMFALAVAVHWT